MKSLLRNLLLPVAGLALAATAATAAPWPPAAGDLILGVRATGGTGATTNVFFNLGPAHTLRDNPNPAGTLVNLDAELTSAFGAGWSARNDLYFGVFANRSNKFPGGIDPGPTENGDPSATVYASKGTTVAGSATPWAGYSQTALVSAATSHQGMITAIATVAANGNNVMTMTQAANPVPWNNGWTAWNPVPGAAFNQFTGGIQAQINATAALVDVFRIVSTSGTGSYVTTVSLAANGDVTAARAGGATSYFTVTATATNGAVSGAGTIVYAQGSTARLTAAPATGFGFVNWSGDASGSANPLNLVMDSNKNVTANFAPFPSVTSPTATDITGTDATLGGNITSDGGQALTERGVVFAINSVNPAPQIGGSGVTKATASGTSTGVFTTTVNGLTAGGVTYAYAAFATSAAGTGYSTVGRFTTDTTVTFTGGVGSVTGREILAGDSHLFRFNVATDTVADFSGTGATNTGWELRDSSNGLVASGTGNVTYADVLTAGDYTLRLTNTGGTAETVSFDLDVSNAVEPVADVSVGTSAAAPIGANVYSPTAQSVAITSKKANAVSGFFAVDNDGPLDDTFKVQGSPGNALFAVSYFQGTTNVTAQVIAGTFTTASIAEGDAAIGFRAGITPNKKKIVKKGKKGKKGKTLKKTNTSLIKVTADSNASITDSATIVVRTQ
ncbi:MAG: hypothetical protein JNJ70_14740 [Verrucomicrobiales bacterium]|nr:hypothetical protein [Verrucomicrobiales bacterium]